MRRFLVLSLVILALCGCGGGGSSSGNPTILRTDTFTVAANQAANPTFGTVTITVPVNTFPAGSQLTLVQYDPAHPPARPPNPNFGLAYPAFQLECTNAPTQPITVSVAAISNQTLIGGIQDGSSWDNLPTAINGNSVSVTLPLAITPQSQTRFNPFQAVYNWVMGIPSGGDPPDNDHALHLVAGSGPLGPNSAVIVHGILDNYQSMTPMATELQAQLGFTNVYSFAYDWRIDGATAAGYLVSDLAPVSNQTKSLTLIGHSRGVTIVRYALEKLNDTAAVKSAILICGPNEGAVSADLGQVVSGIFSFWLNDPLVPGIDLPLLNRGDPCVSEISLGSSFLGTLNSKTNQRGAVSYYLVATTKPGSTDSDGLVGINSAHGADITWPNQTSGAVYTATISGVSHGDIKTDLAKIDEIATFVKAHPTQNSDVTVTISPNNPVDPDWQGLGWDYAITVTNNSSQTVTLDDLLFDTFFRDGSWSGGNWYDPNTVSGQFFPSDYYAWEYTLGSGSSVTVNITSYADTNRDPIGLVTTNQQAVSVVPTLHYTRGDTHAFLTAPSAPFVQTEYNGLQAAGPGTRSPHPTHGGGQTLVGPAKK